MSFCPADEFLMKVCGITRVEDLEAAVDLGVNAVGLNFYPRSPRYVEPGTARRLLEKLRSLSGPEVLAYGVVVLPPGSRTWPKELRSILPELDGIQVHGTRRPQEIPPFTGRLLVAVSPEGVRNFPDHPVIVDTSWGTGRKADWSQLRSLGGKFVLAGGLDPSNVQEALHLVHPAGVDVCSGVEVSPGRKDPARLRAFVEEVEKYLKERELGVRS
ncbi:MAG: phosphoribosylanthranilate isomerase [Acidobacteriota bacterium]